MLYDIQPMLTFVCLLWQFLIIRLSIKSWYLVHRFLYRLLFLLMGNNPHIFKNICNSTGKESEIGFHITRWHAIVLNLDARFRFQYPWCITLFLLSSSTCVLRLHISIHQSVALAIFGGIPLSFFIQLTCNPSGPAFLEFGDFLN